jgi:hypothetical protein
MMAEMDAGMGRVKSATAGVMAGNPAMPGSAVVPRDPDPIVPFVPVTAAMIIRPITNADREIDRFRLWRERGCERHHRGQKNQNFRFHTLFDYLLRKLFTASDYSQTPSPSTQCATLTGRSSATPFGGPWQVTTWLLFRSRRNLPRGIFCGHEISIDLRSGVSHREPG